MVRPWLAPAVALLLLGAAARGGEPLIPKGLVLEQDEAEAAVVAQIFLESMAAGRANLLGNMGADPFTFDGRVVRGREAITATWKDILDRKARLLTGQGAARLDTFAYPEALKRFGPPPKKLAHLDLKKCMFTSVTFKKRPGFLIIMHEGAEKGEGWVVTGVTE